jgi:putative tryptophan/tyrosine transport system substrate-binding protein
MRRREFIAILGSAVATWPMPVRAQSRKPVVGILDPGLPEHYAAFRQAMSDLGYVQGESVSYLYRSAEGDAKSVHQLAIDLVRASPSVIVTNSALPVHAAMEATSKIPIVIASVADAVTAGLVKNVAHPGGNVTGLSFLNTELSSKRLGLLFEALPNIRRVAVLWDSNTPKSWQEATEEAGHALGAELHVLEVAGPDEFEAAFETAAAGHSDALDVLSSTFFLSHKHKLVALAAKHHLPAMYEHADFVRAGGLIAYGPSILDLFRRAATYVDKILKGAQPGDLPIEQPTRFKLSLNLGTARALGLLIEPSLFARADEVIE